MDRTKGDPEILALEGSSLLMRIGAESTIITFKIEILSINVKKFFSRKFEFIQNLKLFVNLDFEIRMFINTIFQIFHSPFVGICILLGTSSNLFIIET